MRYCLDAGDKRVTPEAITFMVTHARGLVRLALTPERCDELRLQPMRPARGSGRTNFTVSIEASHGVSTGISSRDRARTIMVAADPRQDASAIVQPGHVVPVRTAPGGVLGRRGLAEGAVDLARAAGVAPAAVLCHVLDDDGGAARAGELRRWSARHGVRIVRLADIIAQRLRTEPIVRRSASTRVPTDHGTFELIAFRSLIDGGRHLPRCVGPSRGVPRC